MRRATLALIALALVGLAAPTSVAAVTLSCQLVPHGFIFGINTNGCTVSAPATQSILAVVSVTQGTVDAIEIEMLGPTGSRHVFLCTYQVATSVCVLPVQQSNVVDGTWSVTARIVAADPLGPFLFGGADTYARLDATFN